MRQLFRRTRESRELKVARNATKILKDMRRMGERGAEKATSSQGNPRFYLLFAGALTLTIGLMGFGIVKAKEVGEERSAEERRARKERIVKVVSEIMDKLDRLQERRDEQERIRRMEHRIRDTSDMPLVGGCR